jgi:hypothetical protein
MVSAVSGTRQRAPGWFVHLAVDQDGAIQHARCLHLVQHLVALAAALAHAGKNRNAVIAGDHRVDQFHHQHGLADAGAAEHRRLAALGDWRKQVDDLDAGLEYLRCSILLGHRRWLAMDRQTRHIGRQWIQAVRNIAHHIDHATQGGIAHRRRDWLTGQGYGSAAGQTLRLLKSNRPDCSFADMGLYLGGQPARTIVDNQRMVDGRQRTGHGDVQHWTTHSNQPGSLLYRIHGWQCVLPTVPAS